MVEITKELDSTVVWNNFVILDDKKLKGTVLDRRIKVEGGTIKLPVAVKSSYRTFDVGEGIPIPPAALIPPFVREPTRMAAYLTPTQRLYNAVVRACNSCNARTTPGKIVWLGNILTRLTDEIVGTLSGKTGWIRGMFFSLPLAFSGRGVTVPDIELAPNEITLPERIARAWVSKPAFRSKMKIDIGFSNHEAMNWLAGRRILVGRQPTHTVSNMMAFRIGGYSKDVIGIHPSVIGMMHGDFDGDTIWVAAVENIPEQLYLENMVGGYYSPQKEYKIYGMNAQNYTSLENNVWYVLDESIKGQSITPGVTESYPGYLPGKYLDGITRDEFLSLDGAMSYKALKRDVAVAGGLSGTLVTLALALGSIECVEEITKFRHSVAQSALDRKHGMSGGRSVLDEMQSLLYRNKTRQARFIELAKSFETRDTVLGSIDWLLGRVEGKTVVETIESVLPHHQASKGRRRATRIPKVIRTAKEQFRTGYDTSMES